MTPREEQIPRPLRAAEWKLVYATTAAKKGWIDLLATQRNAVVEAWERLTADPLSIDGTCHPLKGELATVSRSGRAHDQWQYELKGGARIWFYVEERTVHIVRVFTAHPNQTK